MAEFNNEFDELENVESEETNEETEVENESVPTAEPEKGSVDHYLTVTEEGQRVLAKTVAEGVVRGGIILFGLKVVKDAVMNSTPVLGIRQRMAEKKLEKLTEKAAKAAKKENSK